MNKNFYLKLMIMSFLIAQNLMAAEQPINEQKILRDHPKWDLSLFDPSIKSKQSRPYYAVFASLKNKNNFKTYHVYSTPIEKIEFDQQDRNILWIRFVTNESISLKMNG